MLICTETIRNSVRLKYWLLLCSDNNTRIFDYEVVIGAKIELEGLVRLMLLAV